MARIGAFVLVAMLVSFAFGCAEKSSSVEETGMELSFENCLTFAAWVWIDGEFVGAFTSEQPTAIEVGAGSHTLFVKSNIVVADTSFCWNRSFSVSDGSLTPVRLDCVGAHCETPTTLEMLNPAIKR